MTPAVSDAVTVEEFGFPAWAQGAAGKATVLVNRAGDDLVLRERRRVEFSSVFVVGFLLLWWLGWTAGCAFLLGHVLARPELDAVLFAIPFLDFWFFVLLVLLAACFGHTEVRLGPGGLEEPWGLLGLRGGRHVPLDEVAGVTEFVRVVDSQSGRTALGLRILTRGRSVRLAVGAEAEERHRLVALLEGHLQSLQGGLTPVIEPGPPWDSEITLERDAERLVFERRSSRRVGAIAVLTFFNLSWNLGIAAGLVQSVKHSLWFGFLFLIPFEVIGAFMLAAWISALTWHRQRRRWTFGPEAISVRRSLVGLGRTRTYDPLGLEQVEIRKHASNRSWLTPCLPRDEAEDRAFALGFVHGGRDTFLIGELTEGEARWMESEVGAWLKRRRAVAPTSLCVLGSVWDRWLDGPA